MFDQFPLLLSLLQTNSLAQIMKGIQALMSDYADGFNLHESEVKANDSEKIDALEVIQISCSCTFIYAYTCF